MTVMFPFVLNVISLLLVVVIAVVAMFGSRRTRIAALAGGVFWLAGFLVTFVGTAANPASTTLIFFFMISGVLQVFAVGCLALAGILPPPVPDVYPRTNPTYTPNPQPYGTGQPGGYEHLPRAGEAPPRNFPQN